jgi:hypothetical protein
MTVTRKKRNNWPKNQVSKRSVQGEKNKPPFNSNTNNPGGTRNNVKSGAVNITKEKTKNQNFEVGAIKKGGQAKKRRFDNVANTSNVVGPLVNGPGGHRKGLSNTHHLHKPNLLGSGQSTGAKDKQPNLSPSPPADFVLLQREIIENRLEKKRDQVPEETNNLQQVDDQDTELEYVQETPMDGGKHHENMCQ